MGIFTGLIRLPLRPAQGTIRLAEMLQEEAERELRDPATVRRELEEAERLHAAGEISDDEFAAREEEITSRLTVVHDPVQDPLLAPEGS